MKSKHLLTVVLFIGVFGFYGEPLDAYPALTWKHLSSEHFTLSYNERTAYLAEEALRVAEEVHARLLPLWGEKNFRGKISIALFDDEDDSNGGAYYYQSLIQILCRRTTFLWRGETDWLRTVLSHELSHIYSLRGLGLPMVFRASAGYVSSKNKVASGLNVTFTHNDLPAWYVEGMAQYGSREFQADVRDAWREMLLRDAFLNGKLLSLAEMARFEGTSREYELAYNQGFSFLIFLAEKGKLASLAELNQKILTHGFEEGIRKTLGQKLPDLFVEWKASLALRYAGFTKSAPGGEVLYPGVAGPYVAETGRSDDGTYVIANWKHDYERFDLLSPFNNKKIADVGPVFYEDPRTREIFYTRLAWNTETGTRNYDLFRTDFTFQENQLTRGERTLAFAYEKGVLVYAAYRNGQVTLKKIRLDPDWGRRSWKDNQKKIETLHVFTPGEEVFHLGLSGEKIFLSLGKKDRIHGAVFQKGQLVLPWENIPGDMLDFFPDKELLYFVSTRDGSPQIYRLAMEGDGVSNLASNISGGGFGEWNQVTRVSGGARYPKVVTSRSGKRLTFSEFRDGHFKLTRKNLDSEMAPVSATNLLLEIEKPVLPGRMSMAGKAKKVPLNFVGGVPVLGLSWSFTDPRSGGSLLDSSGVYAQGAWGIQDSTGDFSLSGSATVDVLGLIKPLTHIPYQYYTGLLTLPVGPFRWENYYGFEEEFYTNDSADQSSFYRLRSHYLQSDLYWQFDDKLSAGLGFQSSWQNQDESYRLKKSGYVYKANGKTEISYNYPEVHRKIGGGVNLNYFHSLGSRLNLAGLGGDAWGFSAEMSASHFQFNQAYWNDNYTNGLYNTDPNVLISHRSRVFYKQSVFKNILSFQLSADLSLDLPTSPKDGTVAPYFYRSVGGESFFSGFAQGMIWGNAIFHLSAEVRVNPFLNLGNRIQWYERLSLGLKYEDGYIFQIIPGETASWFVPRSVELSLRFPFYLRRSSPGTVTFKFAAPFLLPASLAGYLPPYQIYGGISF